MYYKIENKESKVYKDLHALRIKEKNIEKENEAAIAEKVGLEYSTYYGDSGQQNFRRVPQYSGFQFKSPEKVDSKIWRQEPTHPEVYIPNRKTKDGRKMSDFLLNGLKGSRYDSVLEILKVDHERSFTLPFAEIVKETIVIYLGNGVGEPKDKNVIEITKKEFNELLKSS